MNDTIERRPFGTAGDHVSVIGLGGAFLNKHSFDEGVATIHRALELGITFFDTAPAYCGNESQIILGEALATRPEPHMVSTKLSRSRSEEALRAQLADNLKRLKRARVDVLHAHEADYALWWEDGASHGDGMDLDTEYDFANAPIVRVLDDAKKAGLTRYTSMAADRGDRIVRILERVHVDACLSAHQYTLLHRESPRIVRPVAVKRRIPYIVAAIYQRVGVHTGKLDPRIADIVEETGISAAALSVRYLLGDLAIATILLGASNPDEIEEAAWAAMAGPLPPKIQRAIDALGESKPVGRTG